jgi:hypothetical protein
MKHNAIKRTIELANSGKAVPALSMVKADPELAATVSKLVSGPLQPHYGKDGNRAPTAPQTAAFKNVSQHTAQNIQDAETVLQILPDMDLARQILVASILSPKDMTTGELTYNAPEGLMAPEILAAMLARARQHFEQDYKIQPLLSQILSDMLFYTGSYAVAVIPENSIDEVINSPRNMSMESFADHIELETGMMRPLGVLGPAIKKAPSGKRAGPGLALESFNGSHIDPQVAADGRVTFEGIMDKAVDDSYLHVTDNIHVLKIPQINQKIRENRISDVYGISSRVMAMESALTAEMKAKGMKPLNDRELSQLVFKNTQYGHNPITSLKTQEQLTRRTVGNPLILHLPSESVIPVFIPGSPEEQIGFFVLVDSDGNPVSRMNNTDYYQELTSRLNANGNFPSAMLTKARSMMGGFQSVNSNLTDYSVRYYQEIVEADLLARLRNGYYGNGVKLARREEIYRIMLARTLAKQYTQLLFVPVELMTYFAFKHSPDGIGESLLDNMKVLNSMRAMLMFANLMAGIKNSIGRTAVNLNLDPDDPDPKKTIELATHEIVRSRQQYFPLGMNSPTDLVDWLQRSGFEFTWDGHPGIPSLKIDFQEKNSTYVKPDTDLSEGLDKKAIMATGLSPDNIDAAFHADFATSIVQNNILLSKRITQYQDMFTPQLSDHARKVMLTSQRLRDDLRKILMDNYDQLRPDRQDQSESTAQAESQVQEQVEGKSKAQFTEAVKLAVARQKEQGNTGEENGTGAQPGQDVTPEEANTIQPKPQGVPYSATSATPEELQAPAKKTTETEPTALDTHKKNFIVEEILDQFIRGFEIILPRPTSVTLENQMNSLKAYGDALDQGLDAWVSEKFFTQETAGEVSSDVTAIREAIKAYYMRKFMSENGILPELAELTTADESGKPALNIFDAHLAHFEGIMRSLTENVVKMTTTKNASTDILTKIGATNPAGGGTGDEGGTEGGDNAFPGFDETPSPDEATPSDEGGADNGSPTPAESPEPSPAPEAGNKDENEE